MCAHSFTAGRMEEGYLAESRPYGRPRLRREAWLCVRRHGTTAVYANSAQLSARHMPHQLVARVKMRVAREGRMGSQCWNVT